MGLAYGTPIPRTMDGPHLDVAQRQAEERLDAGRDYLWRIEAVSYSVGDGYGDWTSTGPRLELFAREVGRWTPCGARLLCGRWVDLRDGHKQWASRTVAEAMEQFKSRRRAQIRVLQRQLSRAENELRLTEPALWAPLP